MSMAPVSIQTLHTFFVYAPDKTEKGIFGRRFEVRPHHMDAVMLLVKSGILSEDIYR